MERIRSPINRQNASDCLLGASGFIFNTEAHPIDVSAVHCCSKEKVDEDLEVKRILQRISLISLLKEDESGIDGEDILGDVFDNLMGWHDDDDKIEEEQGEDDVEIDAEREAMMIEDDGTEEDDVENNNHEDSAPSDDVESERKTNESADTVEEATGADTSAGYLQETSEISLEDLDKLRADEEAKEKLLTLADNFLQQSEDVSSLATPPESDNLSSSSPANVEAKIKEILQKREEKSRIVASGPAVAEAESTTETWRQLAANILTRLKVDAGLKVAEKLKALFEEPKTPNPKLRSNDGSWASMTCPRRSWPAEIGVYSFH